MKDEDIEAIVNMLDNSFGKKGVGHINLISDDKQKELLKEVAAEQCGVNTPCQVPNFKDIEDRRKL